MNKPKLRIETSLIIQPDRKANHRGISLPILQLITQSAEETSARVPETPEGISGETLGLIPVEISEGSSEEISEGASRLISEGPPAGIPEGTSGEIPNPGGMLMKKSLYELLEEYLRHRP